ncbi:MAG: para-aminobenzoate synthetase/4-amino-4-deoxychorismate lyase [Candidatus Promineifilaceae bacterium]
MLLLYGVVVNTILETTPTGAPARFDLGDYKLTESLLWTPEDGFFLMDLHMRRLLDAAQRCGVTVWPWRAMNVLHHAVRAAPRDRLKVRLRVSPCGLYRGDAKVIPPTPSEPLLLRWASAPIDSTSPYMYYKTTNRSVYDKNLAENSAAGDVMLYNERGEVTETCLANIVIKRDGKLFTPAIRCGLLAGTFRQSLIDAAEIEEAILTRQDVENAEQVFIVNSVRKWRLGQLI